jgi:hypothetical protein
MSDYVTVQLRPAARVALWSAKAEACSLTGGAVTLSATLHAALAVAAAHPQEFAAALAAVPREAS